MTPELEDYIERHISPESDLLKKIDRHTNLHHLNGRMCSGHIQGRLLKMLTTMINPKRVVELGSFTGYSALCIAEGLEEDAEIHTIEANDELEDEIKENLKNSPHGDKVTLHIGDALSVLDKFKGLCFDMAVIDADKRQYPQYFKKLLPMVKSGGYILADNTLWDSHVTEQGKHSSQTQGIIQFNDIVASTPGVEIAMIPMRDGLTLIRKI
ncbi:MAG: class I SAM-dependent methyltransferase [Muribaculaceae bacterium]|nr:class I SAM-dependent methyltransferase [Muribaculaceae bacterium]